MSIIGGTRHRRHKRKTYRTTKKNNRKARSHSMRKYIWSKFAPNTRQRTVMLRNCGKKCFLGPHKSFPICRKNTCKRNKAGIHAAYVRARELQTRYSGRSSSKRYARIASKAKYLLK